MLNLAPGWTMDLERGPEWLFFRLHGPHDGLIGDANLAGPLWAVLEQEFTRRLVLELGELDLLRSWLVGQLVLLHRRLHAEGGMLRIAGLSDRNQDVLRLSQLADRFPHYRTRAEAVMGHRPGKPR